MENNLRTIGYVERVVSLVDLAQVTRVETDYCFPLAAQDDKMLKVYSAVAKEKSRHLLLTSNATDVKGYFKS